VLLQYWRGRIWGPHQQLIYWGLKRYDHVPAVHAVRQQVVAMGKALMLLNWRLFHQVVENMNGVIGIGEDVGNADPFYVRERARPPRCSRLRTASPTLSLFSPLLRAPLTTRSTGVP
jgi:hypothetical protein